MIISTLKVIPGKPLKTKLENKDFLTMTMNYNLSWAKFKLQLKYSRSLFFQTISIAFLWQTICMYICVYKEIHKKCRYFAFGALLSTEFYALHVKFLFLHARRSFQWARILPKLQKLTCTHTPYYISLFRAKRQIIMIALGLRPLYSSNIPSTDLNDVSVVQMLLNTI